MRPPAQSSHTAATATAIYTLSLHDALPILTHDVAEAVALADRVLVIEDGRIAEDVTIDLRRPRRRGSAELAALEGRSEEHTSELQSRPHLVCRHLLGQKYLAAHTFCRRQLL